MRGDRPSFSEEKEAKREAKRLLVLRAVGPEVP
jgi:hypothetical protein